MAVLVTVLAVFYVLPSFESFRTSPLGKVLPDDVINLGLDLKGGIHLTLEVDVDKAVSNSLAQLGQELRDQAREEKILLLRPRITGQETLEVLLLKGEQRDQLRQLLDNQYPNVRILDTRQAEDDKEIVVLGLIQEYREQLARLTIDQAVKTIRNRIDQFGVAEPDIRKQEGGRIQVQLPGLSDTERAIAIIGQTAHLEFKVVDDTADIQKALNGILPPGSELAFMERTTPAGEIIRDPLVVEKEAAFTGQYITDARVVYDEFGQPYVSLSFNNRGARIFERVTGDNVKKRLAIVLDGKIHSAPVIQEKITGGQASISGQFTDEEARDLAIVLRAGALPAPVNILEERTVGPSLGQESIDKGVMSALLGGALVLLFMVLYYGFAGIVADFVLVLNIILIMAGLAAFGATLTLPGIAGIILTIGMAVDANVLIFERIREELRSGMPVRKAVDEGYGRATLTILDANVTTIIAAIILYQFGTGPVRGFAVTLSLGILASMFTAIFVSRIFFDLWTMKRKGAQLSI